VAYETKRARIERDVRESIAQGIYQPDEKLPSARDLAVRHRVSLATAQDALTALKDEGLIEGRQGDGYYLATSERRPSLEERVSALEAWRRRVERGER
jgi:DNA-binding GntR family transcriptional regulator